MRVLMVGAGGVGASAAMIAARRDFFDLWIVADYDYARAEALVERIDDPRFIARQVDAGNPDEVAGMAISNEVTHILNLVDPRFFKQDAGVGEWVDAMVRVAHKLIGQRERGERPPPRAPGWSAGRRHRELLRRGLARRPRRRPSCSWPRPPCPPARWCAWLHPRTTSRPSPHRRTPSAGRRSRPKRSRSSRVMLGESDTWRMPGSR